MSYQKVALSIALSCTLVGTLSACSDDGSSTDASDASSPATVTQTVKESNPSEAQDQSKFEPTRKSPAQESEPGKKPGKQCGDLPAEEALRENVGKLASPKGTDWTWNTKYAGTDLYDPCAELSPIVLTINGATGSSPYHIMLFHKGEYLGTATAEPQGFSPDVKQVDGKTLAVTYFYTKPGEANAERSGEAHATFTWDPAQEKVIMDGNLPPKG